MKYFLLLAAFLTAVSVEAQQLKGRVADAQGQPVAFANVVLLRADSSFVSGNVSDETGNFSLDLAGNPTLLKVSYIGYQDLFISLAGKPIWAQYNCGKRLRHWARWSYAGRYPSRD